jgi:CheY-like chemotaxis protein
MAKVLIVDDEESYRDSLVWLVSGEGHDVRAAASGRDAIQIGRKMQPDVLIVDWMLGDRVDGIEVAETLREDRPDVKTIIITGYPSPELRTKAEHAGVWALLEKPFSVQDIRDALRRAVAE